MSAALIKLVHVGCRELGIDGESRRDLQLLVTGKESLTQMTGADLEKMVGALKARGFKPGFKPGSSGRKARPAAPRADLRFVHVMWSRLGAAGSLTRPGRDGLNAFIRARFEKKWASVPIDIDTLRDAGQINDVTRALKAMCPRAGVDIT